MESGESWAGMLITGMPTHRFLMGTLQHCSSCTEKKYLKMVHDRREREREKEEKVH